MTVRPTEETFDRGMDLSLWRKLFRYVRPYRRNLAALMFFGAGTASIDAAFPLVTRAVIDDVTANGFRFTMEGGPPNDPGLSFSK